MTGRPAKHGGPKMFTDGCRCDLCVAGGERRREAKRLLGQSEAKHAHDREYVAAKRAAMTPEERAAARLEQDRLYRERHREERRAYDRHRGMAVKLRRWAKRQADTK